MHNCGAIGMGRRCELGGRTQGLPVRREKNPRCAPRAAGGGIGSRFGTSFCGNSVLGSFSPNWGILGGRPTETFCPLCAPCRLSAPVVPLPRRPLGEKVAGNLSPCSAACLKHLPQALDDRLLKSYIPDDSP
jgi:hypothetical protein